MKRIKTFKLFEAAKGELFVSGDIITCIDDEPSKARPVKYLQKDQTYTVKNSKSGDYDNYVVLEEIPDLLWNTRRFKKE